MLFAESVSVCGWPLWIRKVGGGALSEVGHVYVQWMSFLKPHREFLRQPFVAVCSGFVW